MDRETDGQIDKWMNGGNIKLLKIDFHKILISTLFIYGAKLLASINATHTHTRTRIHTR